MSERFKLVKLGNRGGMFYCKDTLTNERKSLHTKDRKEAEKLVFHKNEAVANVQVCRKVGMAYLGAADPELTTRTWEFVMEDIIKDKHGPTLHRYETALKDEAYNLIKKRVLLETLPEHFKAVLRAGTVSTNVYLRRLQNHALDMGWLPVAILPKKKFDKIVHKEARAITWEEHCRILAREGNAERRDYYELLWYFGGSQSDIALLDNDDIERDQKCFSYERCKNSHLAGTKIGPKAWAVIERRPKTGPLFPYLSTVREADRATEFKQRCDGLRISGVTLHSYRYAWAERGANNGYPERYAQRALGQNSKAVHRAYAKKAQGQLPSLEDYEEANRKAKENGKIVMLRPEAEFPIALDTCENSPQNLHQGNGT